MNNLRKALLTTLMLQSTGAIAGDLIDESRDVNADAVIDVEIMNGVVTLTARLDRTSGAFPHDFCPSKEPLPP